ncbi:MAG: endolytic transglycosylase MltG [Acidimicrobiales bacterium]
MPVFDQDDTTADRTVTTGSDVVAGLLEVDAPTELVDDADLGWDDDEYVTIRPAWWRVGRGLLILAVIAFGVWTAYQAGRGWFDRQLDPEGEQGEAITVIVESGSTTSDIARLLESLDIIPNSTFFRYYVQWTGEQEFQAGEYEIPVNSSVDEAIAVLVEGPKPQQYERFTIREGLWIDEIIPDIASQLDNVTEAQLWAALDSGAIPARYRPDGVASYEGLLFPDTYEVNAEATAEEVLLKMANEFTSVTGDLGYGGADTLIGYSAYEVLIVASLIEAETRVPEERPQVASVIYNRLREQWPLGIDATCIYGVGDRQVQLTNEILQAEGPYNCRNVVGLPPTPINAPSESSLAAALNPAESTFMYYVLTDPSGAHTFATTDEEFAEAKAICVELDLGCG